MKKLFASIIVLIITSAISFTLTEIDSDLAVNSYKIKKTDIPTNTIAATTNKIKN